MAINTTKLCEHIYTLHIIYVYVKLMYLLKSDQCSLHSVLSLQIVTVIIHMIARLTPTL